MMTNLAISDTSNRRDVSFDAKFALRHKLSLSDALHFHIDITLSASASTLSQQQFLLRRKQDGDSMWTMNGYHMKMNRDVFRPLEGYKNQRRAIMKFENREPDNFDKQTALLPRGISKSAGTGAFHNRSDLRLAGIEAYFPSAAPTGEKAELKNTGFDPKYTATRLEHWKELEGEIIEKETTPGGVLMMSTAKRKEKKVAGGE